VNNHHQRGIGVTGAIVLGSEMLALHVDVALLGLAFKIRKPRWLKEFSAHAADNGL
jgi:hypothetical protein